jgi:biopolymer transport protein ExbB
LRDNVIVSLFSPVTTSMPLRDLLAQAGWAMWPIYLCSVLTVGMFVKKVFDLRAARLHDVSWLDRVRAKVRAGDFAAAGDACRSVVHPAAKVVAAVINAMEEAPAQIEPEGKRVASLELQKLESGLAMLAFLAQVSPLLGLLGTVLGMVEMFMGLQGAEQGSVVMSDLASGIWKALLTTAAGLTVAVPALAGHTYLASRIDAVRLQMIDIVQRVIFDAGRTREREA